MILGSVITVGFKYFFVGGQVLFNLLSIRRVPALFHKNLLLQKLNSYAKIQR